MRRQRPSDRRRRCLPSERSSRPTSACRLPTRSAAGRSISSSWSSCGRCSPAAGSNGVRANSPRGMAASLSRGRPPGPRRRGPGGPSRPDRRAANSALFWRGRRGELARTGPTHDLVSGPSRVRRLSLRLRILVSEAVSLRRGEVVGTSRVGPGRRTVRVQRARKVMSRATIAGCERSSLRYGFVSGSSRARGCL